MAQQPLLARLIDLLELVDTPMIEVEATVEQLKHLQYWAACLDEWARIGLASKGATPVTDFEHLPALSPT